MGCRSTSFRGIIETIEIVPLSKCQSFLIFHLQHVSLEEGVMAMANTRSKWMDTPERSV